MANQDNGQDQDEQERRGGGIIGVGAGAAAGYGAAIGTAKIAVSGASKKTEAADKAVKDAKDALETKKAGDAEFLNKEAGFKTAENEYIIKVANPHFDELRTQWNNIIEKTEPKELKKLQLADLEGQLTHLDTLKGNTEISAESLESATKGVKAQIEAIKLVDEKSADAVKKIQDALEKPWKEALGEKAESATAFMQENRVYQNESVFASLEKNASKETLAKVTEKTASKAGFDAATKTFKETESTFKQAESSVIGKEAKDLESVTTRAAALTEMKQLGEQTGWRNLVSLPVNVIKKGTGKAKLAVAAGAAVALCATYMGVKMIRNSGHADRVEQERQQTGGAQVGV